MTSFLDLPRSASVTVDLHHPYYCDDSSVVPSSELLIPQSLQLHVSDLSIPVKGIAMHRLLLETLEMIGHSTLDICLDCFDCLNPFLTELEACDRDFSNTLVSVT